MSDVAQQQDQAQLDTSDGRAEEVLCWLVSRG